MKKLKRTYLMAAVALLTAGCSEQDAINQQGRTPVNLGYTVVESQTRAATNLNENYLSSGTLMVSVKAHGDADYPDFVAYTGADDGALTPPSEGQFYYPGGTTADIVACYPSESFSAVQTDQTTDAAYLASDLMWAAVENQQATTHMVNLQLRHLMSKIVVNATAGEGLSGINSVKLVNVKPGIASFDPATGTVGDATGDAGAITMTNNGAALIPKQTIDGAFIEIATDLGIATYAVDNKTFLSGYQYTYNITVNYYAIGTTNTIEAWNEDGKVTVSPTAGDDIPNHAPSAVTLVDLGLPSGTLWANMNVGATAVTDYGTYFAWGETYGMTVSGATNTIVDSSPKQYFNWACYLWGDGTGNQKFTKYCSPIDNDHLADGFPGDTKTELDLSDDAAYVNWGGNWRMPTKAEYEELVANTTSVWTTEGGFNGYRFTSNASGNTNSIFLPAAGMANYSNTEQNSTQGHYWAKTLGGGSRNGLSFDFQSDGTHINNNFRMYGFSVRPVWHDASVPLAEAKVGYKVGSNGKAYPVSSDFPSGVTLKGVIAYKDGSSGLVISSSDASGTYTWYAACSYSASAGYFYVSDFSSPTAKTWICGNRDQYENCGVHPSWNTLSSMITDAGGTGLSGRYWTTTTSPTSNDHAWPFSSDGYVNSGGYTWPKSNSYYVRPIFAF